ncbi:DUF3179 domain-containing (seleno)protein [Fulvivirgaceae bacterium BMA10]|uniref:DUF3179 domain-containing (Seleno)protein n=1 Tax=Splendidivirga corallicola TaxID=3051826 RepID=A0ABT8KWV5_9BACT|nr:DUF3179 domain-containing (seleno)protein [Fulvivirgaceae bacterium BMA10]
MNYWFMLKSASISITMFRTLLRQSAIILICFISSPGTTYSQPSQDIEKFLQLSSNQKNVRNEALKYVDDNWQPDYVIMLLDIIYLSRDPEFTLELLNLLKTKTGKNYGYSFHQWYEWIWNNEPLIHPNYGFFKATLYGRIDPKFKNYFNDHQTRKIRLDEVLWGGVQQDGIPPLRSPEMASAQEATFMENDNVVFGIEINGDARAYPKRILAWHEMFVDSVGSIPVAGVYCTLCGTMILYKTEHKGTKYNLGTSGFLFRSNKLMYDRETQSLWNTLWGEPVIGSLAEQDIALERLSVVTTTWEEWKKRHPDTKVLSLNTGHIRDYSEGAAYREYFATDELMFNIPKRDYRLRNKDEILGLILSDFPDKPLALSAKFLKRKPLYHDKIEDKHLVILTDRSGANRVYETKGEIFEKWDKENTLIDDKGVTWTLSESNLKSKHGKILHRLPAHRAFWFGWFSAYSHTRLVK